MKSSTSLQSNYRVSVVIPAYNEESTIGRCLDALTSQSVAPDEIILVDNNSTDDTTKIASTYDNVRIVPENTVQGITAARNTGLDAATGDILCRIDADTVVPNEWIATIRSYFDTNPQAIKQVRGISGSANFNVPYPLWLQKLIGIVILDVGFFAPTWLMLRGHDTLYGSNMAITKHTWKTVRTTVATDDSVHEDVDLSASIIQHGGKIDATQLPRVLVSARSLRETPCKFFWRIRIWLYSAKRARQVAHRP